MLKVLLAGNDNDIAIHPLDDMENEIVNSGVTANALIKYVPFPKKKVGMGLIRKSIYFSRKEKAIQSNSQTELVLDNGFSALEKLAQESTSTGSISVSKFDKVKSMGRALGRISNA